VTEELLRVPGEWSVVVAMTTKGVDVPRLKVKIASDSSYPSIFGRSLDGLVEETEMQDREDEGAPLQQVESDAGEEAPAGEVVTDLGPKEWGEAAVERVVVASGRGRIGERDSVPAFKVTRRHGSTVSPKALRTSSTRYMLGHADASGA
jgi:hypothetical protein